MKRSFIALIILFYGALSCYAQLFSAFELNAGLYNGKPVHEKNIGVLTNEPFKDKFTAKAGFAAEALVYSDVSQRVALGTGMRFTQSNYTHIVGDIITQLDIINRTVTQIRNEVTINNVGIPVLCKLGLGKKSQWLQTIGGFGFYRSFWKVSENKTTGAGGIDPVIRAYPIDNISKDYQLTVQLGIRAFIKIINNHSISIGGRAEYFLLQDKYHENGQGSMMGLSATIGYVFGEKP